MDGKIFIVLGLSGVGKSTACRSFVARHPEYLYVKASDLIHEASSLTFEELRTASSESILENQKLLVKALHLRRIGREDQRVIIDAHSVIDNDRDLVCIPVDVIKSLCPNGFVFLEVDAHTLLSRRMAAKKPRPLRSADELAQQQVLAKEVAFQYAKELCTPIITAVVTDDFDLEPLIRNLDQCC
ncbi:ATP-binding protein [Azospirillum palustre]